MKNYHLYYIIVIAGLLIALGYFINNVKVKEVKVKEKVVVYDTVYNEVQLPPIKIQGKSETKIIYKDTTDEAIYGIVCQLLEERDRLHTELSKYIREELCIDTVAVMDTINFCLDFHTLQWRLDIRHSTIEVPSVNERETEYVFPNDEKRKYAIYGFGGGMLVTLLITLIAK